MADDLENDARLIGHAGNILLGVGALLDGISSGTDYYQKHKDQGIVGGLTDGVLHAGLSTVGAYYGAAGGELVGAALGSALIPIPGLGTVIGGMVGGAVGGYVGGIAGDWAADHIAPTVISAISTVGNVIGSWFH